MSDINLNSETYRIKTLERFNPWKFASARTFKKRTRDGSREYNIIRVTFSKIGKVDLKVDTDLYQSEWEILSLLLACLGKDALINVSYDEVRRSAIFSGVNKDENI